MFRQSAICILILLLMSCIVILPVKTNIDGEIVSFSLNKEGIFIESNREITVLIVEDTSNSVNQSNAVLWHIETIDAPRRIESISYGIVPKHFREITPSAKLIKNTEYVVHIIGPGYTSNGLFIQE